MEPADSPREAAPPGPDPAAVPDGPSSRRDRTLLVSFLVYVLLLALAVYAQLADARGLLDLFDAGRYFTR